MKIENMRKILKEEIDAMDDNSFLNFYGFLSEEQLKFRNENKNNRGKIDLDIDLYMLRDRKDLFD